MSDDEERLREEFKKENRETIDEFKKVVKKLFGDIDDDEWDKIKGL